ncbi:histidine triad nucleotide-binding protein [Porticoccaceae bacterium]|nr:histidine triad nucleotide-binding protein [Porticoccaceae bacterium]MDA8651426.1 histidine triad nucleotide-binding protein [Porticoccaceae bacterium]MDA8663339.1 histidine triad nucleotide-binding protein [Porticoccaceae bacterium]MDA8682301.1 histidine triad nucleotide-binding protein [Porticoccaceae bacterium]MDB2344210.1 histidine triad nucleotide-binding protein [Porticoccaceae bacterium]
MSDMSKTLFTRIIEREIPSDMLYEDDVCVVINDIVPQAPVHMLVIPKKPLPRLVDATVEDQAILGHLLLIAGEMARKFSVDEAFRLVVNNGADAGQTVFHLHLHVLAKGADDEGFSELDIAN